MLEGSNCNQEKRCWVFYAISMNFQCNGMVAHGMKGKKKGKQTILGGSCTNLKTIATNPPKTTRTKKVKKKEGKFGK